MDLASFVEEHRSEFGDLVKVATDIVALLNHPSMQLSELMRRRNANVTCRIRAFEAFCAFCMENGIAPPPLDAGLRSAFESESEKAYQTPDYNTFCIQHAADEEPPPRAARMLIVDDYINEIVRTWRAVRGWPDVEIDALHVTDESPLIGDAFCTDVSQRILDRRPDIVLMDWGLPETGGDRIIQRIRRIDPTHTIIFVANTGGDSCDLNRVGAIGNARKGEDIWSIREGISRIR
jgi:CheY-like chemotaxis protein